MCRSQSQGLSETVKVTGLCSALPWGPQRRGGPPPTVWRIQLPLPIPRPHTHWRSEPAGELGVQLFPLAEPTILNAPKVAGTDSGAEVAAVGAS